MFKRYRETKKMSELKMAIEFSNQSDLDFNITVECGKKRNQSHTKMDAAKLGGGEEESRGDCSFKKLHTAEIKEEVISRQQRPEHVFLLSRERKYCGEKARWTDGGRKFHERMGEDGVWDLKDWPWTSVGTLFPL